MTRTGPVWLTILLAAALVGCGQRPVADEDPHVAPVPTVQELPAAMEGAARRWLHDVLPPGPPRLLAFRHGRPVRVDRLDDAEAVGLAFGTPGTRSWRLVVDSDAGAFPPRCPARPVLPEIRCDLSHGPDGSVLVARFRISVRDPDAGPDDYLPADPDLLAEVEPSAVRVDIDVEQYHHGGGRTTVTETVLGPSWPLDDNYFTALPDLIRVVQSPRIARIPGRYPGGGRSRLWDPLAGLD